MTSCSDNIIQGQVLSFVLETDLDQLDNLHERVKYFCEVHCLENKTLFETNLVLEEIFANIVSYGHEDKDKHQVRFSLKCTKECLEIQIEDDGIPFNLLEAKPVELDKELEEKSAGGLGIHLVLKLMDEVNYKRKGTTNVVTLQKYIVGKKEK